MGKYITRLILKLESRQDDVSITAPPLCVISSSRNHFVKIILSLCVYTAVLTVTYAQQPNQGGLRIVRTHTFYEVNSDGTAVITTDGAIMPLEQTMIPVVGQAMLPYQEGTSEVEILEAYTLKQDGTRVNVQQDHILTQSPPVVMQAPTFSDMKLKQIIFPDVSVKDQVVLRSRIRITQPVFPRQFSDTRMFNKAVLNDDVSIRVKYPKSFPLQFKAHEMQEMPAIDDDESVTREWRFNNTKTEQPEPAAADPMEQNPYVMMSSFADWGEIARSYETRANEKSAVTTEVQRLATEITKDIETPIDQAEAIYRWVSQNIRYVAVYLGAGGYVPHDVDTILRNRYGDCKDQVVVLGALLAAKGIESSPVLISIAPSFHLPPIAVPSAFNHVITWLPQFKLYTDSTAQILPFGVLVPALSGKPVVHTRGIENIQMTPPLDPTINVLDTTVELEAMGNGNATGQSDITGEGSMAGDVAGFTRMLQNQQVRDNAVRSYLNREGLTGTTEYVHDESQLFNKTHKFSISFKLDHWINVSGPGSQRIPSGLFSTRPIADLAIQTLNAPPAKSNRVCPAVTLREQATIRLPPSVKLDALPRNVEFTNAVASYRAQYSSSDGAVKASRTLVVLQTRGFCTPEEIAALYEVAELARRDTTSQLTYH